MAEMTQFFQALNQSALSAFDDGAFAAQLTSFSNSMGMRCAGSPR